MDLEKRIEELEERVAALEMRVPEQPKPTNFTIEFEQISSLEGLEKL